MTTTHRMTGSETAFEIYIFYQICLKRWSVQNTIDIINKPTNHSHINISYSLYVIIPEVPIMEGY